MIWRDNRQRQQRRGTIVGIFPAFTLNFYSCHPWRDISQTTRRQGFSSNAILYFTAAALLSHLDLLLEHKNNRPGWVNIVPNGDSIHYEGLSIIKINGFLCIVIILYFNFNPISYSNPCPEFFNDCAQQANLNVFHCTGCPWRRCWCCGPLWEFIFPVAVNYEFTHEKWHRILVSVKSSSNFLQPFSPSCCWLAIKIAALRARLLFVCWHVMFYCSGMHSHFRGVLFLRREWDKRPVN